MTSLFLLIATIITIAVTALYLIHLAIKSLKIKNVMERNVLRESFLRSQEMKQLKEQINLLKHKELILYLIAEILHNKKDRDTTYTAFEVTNMLSKARVFTPYYGPEPVNIDEMKEFIEYLSNDAWNKVFKKPANETEFRVKEWFEQEDEPRNLK